MGLESWTGSHTLDIDDDPKSRGGGALADEME